MTCPHPTRYHEASQGVTVCLLCEIERLQADNKRLTEIASVDPEIMLHRVWELVGRPESHTEVIGGKEYTVYDGPLVTLEKAMHELDKARADNERLKSFAAGRGMASEAGPEEIAVLVTGLHERVERLLADNERLSQRITELTEQANVAYAPYRKLVEAMRAERNLAIIERDNARADHAIIADITVDGDNMAPDEMRREVHKIAALASRGHSGIKEADELRLTCLRLHAELERVITALAHDFSHCIPEALEQSKRILAETKELLKG